MCGEGVVGYVERVTAVVKEVVRCTWSVGGVPVCMGWGVSASRSYRGRGGGEAGRD